MSDKIKLICSDYDGVLHSSKDIHFRTFNQAVSSLDPKYAISPEDHQKYYDGLSSRVKMKKLHEKFGFPLDKIEEINKIKQTLTLQEYQSIEPSPAIRSTIIKLKSQGYGFVVCSNAVKETVYLGLEKLGIFDLCDKVYTNEDVKDPKPSPSIYLKAMVDAGVSPRECAILEDSTHGLMAAVLSGANVCYIKDPSWFNFETINNSINSFPKNLPIKFPGKSNTTVLIPMAGKGSRFVQAGYELPKPLIETIDGKPMIQLVVETLNIDADYIFVVQKEHLDNYSLRPLLNQIAPNCKIIVADQWIGGAAPHALLAKEYIDNNKQLIIVNSDQFIKWDSIEFMYYMNYHNCNGGILTFDALDKNPKWSYAETNEEGNVARVAEKIPISNKATIGLYWFAKGSDFVKSAEQMITKNIKTNNEFYICPSFNELIINGGKVKIKDCQEMWGLGTPEDLEYFLKNYQKE